MAANSKRVAILVEDLYQTLEVWYPWLRLREEGIEVHFIGTGSKAVYASKEGYPAHVDFSIEDINPNDYDAVVIPGGFAPDILRRFESVVSFIKKLYDEQKVVASICHGGWLLVSADICRGNQLTCFYAIKDDLIAAGGHYIDKEVVVDKNLVTARKPEDLTAFTCEIIKLLNN